MLKMSRKIQNYFKNYKKIPKKRSKTTKNNKNC